LQDSAEVKGSSNEVFTQTDDDHHRQKGC